MSAQAAGKLGAYNTTEALVPLEQLAIHQGRLNHIAPYAHYLDAFGLPWPKRVEDVSTDPRVVDFLKRTYGTPDRIEFYPGLFAEDRVRNTPLPNLTLRMVAVDAFSQAFTNPLLSQRDWQLVR
jgi:prostaglandin-endoperoxide synthase 2